jgi:hypothetical protein
MKSSTVRGAETSRMKVLAAKRNSQIMRIVSDSALNASAKPPQAVIFDLPDLWPQMNIWDIRHLTKMQSYPPTLRGDQPADVAD